MSEKVKEREGATANEARRKYLREWQRKNKEKVNGYNRNYREKNPDKVKKWNQDYWERKVEDNAPLVHEQEKTPVKRKKATFDLEAELHQRLKVYAARHGVDMVDIVETGIKSIIDRGVNA